MATAGFNPMDGKLHRSKQKNALDTLASGIAHELNNILYPIHIYTKLLLSQAEAGSEEHSDLCEILDCALRAGDLISKVRTYSGHDESTKSVSDLVAITHAVTRSIIATKPAKIEFEEQVCRDTVLVSCDPDQISQVLTNLCTNSVQAIANTGKIKITLESMTLDGFECFDGTTLSGRHARVVVTDSGVGMNEATLARVFDPFFSTRPEGAGLGLSTVVGIVRCHKGGISISSKLDIGTTFEVFLPLAKGN